MVKRPGRNNECDGWFLLQISSLRLQLSAAYTPLGRMTGKLGKNAIPWRWPESCSEETEGDIAVENGSEDFLTRSVKTGCQLLGKVDSWISENALNSSGHSSCSSFNFLDAARWRVLQRLLSIMCEVTQMDEQNHIQQNTQLMPWQEPLLNVDSHSRRRKRTLANPKTE